jgi:hypothetical protein
MFNTKIKHIFNGNINIFLTMFHYLVGVGLIIIILPTIPTHSLDLVKENSEKTMTLFLTLFPQHYLWSFTHL